MKIQPYLSFFAFVWLTACCAWPLPCCAQQVSHRDEIPHLENVPNNIVEARSLQKVPPVDLFKNYSFGAPAQELNSISGNLTVRFTSGRTLFFKDKALLQDDYISILGGYSDEAGQLPSIVIIHANCMGNDCYRADLYLVDMGVTPPFVSSQPLPIRTKGGSQFPIKVSKLTEGLYSFSGPDMEGIQKTTIYDRATRTLIENP